MKFNFNLRGEFDICLIHEDGSSTEYRVDNLILNQGLDALGDSGSSLAGIAVGTGNTAVTAADTVLANPLAYSTNLTSSGCSAISTVAPYQTRQSITYTFAQGAVVGNISELGALLNTTAGAGSSLFSRALVQVGGAPGTISVLASDQLIITYRCNITIQADAMGVLSVDIDGTATNFNYTISPLGIGANCYSGSIGGLDFLVSNYNGIESGISANTALAAVTALPTSSLTYPFNSRSGAAYVAGSYYRDFTFHFNTGTARAIRRMVFGCTHLVSFQMLLDATLNTTVDQTFDITMRFTWGAG